VKVTGCYLAARRGNVSATLLEVILKTHNASERAGRYARVTSGGEFDGDGSQTHQKHFEDEF
jgi:hypothetical protein